MSANVQSMFYYGEVPWHGLGTELLGPATAEEAIVASGQDWEVECRALVTDSGIKLPAHRATVRKDTGQVLGVVGRRYTPVQNRHGFEFFDEVVGAGQAIYHTAGVLGCGERVWILAKLPESIEVAKGDVVDKYLTLINSHDGTFALRMFFTPIRIVCQNTLTAAFEGYNSKTDPGITLKHYPNILTKVKQAQDALGLANGFYKNFAEASQVLVQRQLNEKELLSYIEAVIPGNSTQVKNRRQVVRELFDGPKNSLPSIVGSAWSAYNAVTEYVDYAKKVVKADVQPSRRLDSVWFGAGANLKARAWDEALALVGVN